MLSAKEFLQKRMEALKSPRRVPLSSVFDPEHRLPSGIQKNYSKFRDFVQPVAQETRDVVLG